MRIASIARIARPAAMPRTHPAAIRARTIYSTSILRTSAGYGDPQDEKIENQTPKSQTKKDGSGHEVAGGKPSSSADPHPDGQGKGTGVTGGTTDPEIKPLEGNSNEDKKVSAKETKETKKIGEDPKQEEVGGEYFPVREFGLIRLLLCCEDGRNGDKETDKTGAGVIGG